MVTGTQPKILLTQDKDGNLKMDDWQSELMKIIDNDMNWKLVRERDGLTKQSEKIMWLEWNDNGTFKKTHPLPAPGLSLIMSPFNDFFTWQTTEITEVVEEREDYIKFQTKNSTYELWRLKKD